MELLLSTLDASGVDSDHSVSSWRLPSDDPTIAHRTPHTNNTPTHTCLQQDLQRWVLPCRCIESPPQHPLPLEGQASTWQRLGPLEHL